MAFVDDSNISITTVPDGAVLVFLPSDDQQLPEQLVFEEGMTVAPFSTSIKRSKDEITFAAAVDGYEARVVKFHPDVANLSMRVPLLRTSAVNTTSVSVYDISDPENIAEIQMSDDFMFEFRSIASEYYHNLKKCIKGHPRVITMTLNSENQLEVVSPENSDSCVAPMLEDIAARRKAGALPDLDDIADVSIFLVIL